jgi:hypothetical protein
MGRLRGNRTLAMLLFLPISAAVTWASPDLRLLSLVPTGTQIVAGVSNPMLHGRTDGFLLMSCEDVVDHRDFISLVGVDDSLIVNQILFTAGGSDTGKSGEHSLLMSGHFDQTRIFKAALDNGASVSEFSGIRVLVQQPLAREVGTFKDVRWLALIDSTVAFFGTIYSVQQELTRHLAENTADPSLMQKLARLRRDDATWSILGTVKRNDQVKHTLSSLAPTLANLVHDGDSVQFGVRYGKKVEVEYEITSPSSASTQAPSNSLAQSLNGANLERSLLPPHQDMTADSASVHGWLRSLDPP